jgi:pilus assembly protein CpaF
MRLNDRLKQAVSDEDGTDDQRPQAPRRSRPAEKGGVKRSAARGTKGTADSVSRDAPNGHAHTSNRMAGARPDGPRSAGSGDPLAALKRRTQESLYARLGGSLFRPDMTEAQMHRLVVGELTAVLEADRAPLTAVERARLVEQMAKDVLGFGPLDRFLADPDISEIMVEGTRPIHVERAGKLYATEDRFLFDDQLRRVIDRIVSQVGRRIDESSPMVDARLPDGSRVNAVLPPLSLDGPSLTIRKFATTPFRVEDMIRLKTMPARLADLLCLCVIGKLNIIVSGGTGTGKTTLLNVLSAFIPEDERIVSIEDAAELQLHRENIVRLEARPPNLEDKGEVTIRDLVRNSLRMRPDRIIVGEVRGGEALDMLQAMNTGHEGSLSTLHANSPRDALARLETMVLMAGVELPSRAIREQITSAIDLVVQLSRLRDGSRRITKLSEVTSMEGNIIGLQDIFTLEHAGEVGDDGLLHASLRPTGIRPAFADRLKANGLNVPARLLGSGDPVHELKRR